MLNLDAGTRATGSSPARKMDLIELEQAAVWRTATAADLTAIQKIADKIHVDLPERPEVIAEKIELFPEGCFVLAHKDSVVGYGLSHPWFLNEVPPLDRLLHRLPSSPECLLIHDVAILEQARGRGAASVLMERLVKLARSHGLMKLALVSVYNTRAIWSRLGFKIVADTAVMKKLGSYGTVPRYMVRKLD